MTRSPRLALLGSLAIAGLLLAAPASARPGPSDESECAQAPEMKAVHALKRQSAAEELAAALDLSAAQKTQLAALIQTALAARDDAREARSEAAGDATGVLARYLREVQGQGAPSAATVQEVKALRAARRESRPGKEDREALRTALKATLEEEQLATLASFRPMDAVGDEARGERRRRRGSEARERGRDGAADGDDGDRRARREGKLHAKRAIKRVLFTPEMLDVLTR